MWIMWPTYARPYPYCIDEASPKKIPVRLGGGWIFGFKSSGHLAAYGQFYGRTKSEAVLRFRIAHPGEKLYDATEGLVTFTTREGLMNSLSEYAE